ncbi:MAG: hypothetical protein A3F53_00650 [Candidatus Zambryskibacteria bacterium RIFCSPHIGHO2_12_FULL_48_10]|uniref:MBL fold hydrolase n=1 Tax=Candidatus Zambryskibacteria bacterium RIFCSPHIGHO2_01_FULL_46_25 TaxID=1802738 RepID=A0A1G2SZZ0_9BACT|nr:MAG: RNA-metabolising metallo-beta-lactamase [Parcubacteria group bacterium GW2011_GWA1_47_10]OHA90610.1 MAG: hypothetical protein A2838_02725 [Candidatus Zambryskibacteria bacterium RIFCSPHIGHO2_01_FULL_46_25]OHB01799.1 MAG: hypothetical protein A3F53_00650 [Candidatus Zambryskibacteria bacterium RIFCSPHIGHO2_12_FULL_48_10]OHB07253.1 MAG: hypothetical protein A3A31_01865 [Candidatus Zambryskibacteria bacterium RIFCSPLOWO2_01_FULL_48_25]
MAKLTCYGGAGSATGANFLLEFEKNKILVDCGLLQGSALAVNANKEKFSYDPASIDALFATHAHIDHIGLIPKLYREGFRGDIYSTRATKSIAEFLLADAVKINADDAEPIYGADDVLGCLSLWKTLEYHQKLELNGIKVEFLNAGHILGSAMAQFSFPLDRKMLFTGDLGNSPSPLLPDVEKVGGLDYLLMESVYGDRNHESKEERDREFERVVREAIGRKGTLLIPAFSLERTQVLLTKLKALLEEKKIPSVPVYLDSPLAIRITEIYERVKEGNDFNFQELHETAKIADSREIAEVRGAKIIIAGSGMSTAGRIVGHEEMYLPDPRATILLAGYQAQGTLGREIEEGLRSITIGEKKIIVRAKVEKISGFSSHADSNALVGFASESAKTLKKVFVAMGEPKSQIFLAQRLRDELGVDAVATEKGKSYELDL